MAMLLRKTSFGVVSHGVPHFRVSWDKIYAAPVFGEIAENKKAAPERAAFLRRDLMV